MEGEFRCIALWDTIFNKVYSASYCSMAVSHAKLTPCLYSMKLKFMVISFILQKSHSAATFRIVNFRWVLQPSTSAVPHEPPKLSFHGTVPQPNANTNLL